MIVAFATSTPTSMTVVATSTSSSRRVNASITARRSTAASRPCRQPTRSPFSSALRSRSASASAARASMYFDPGKILYIEGLPADESDAVIDELAGYMVQPHGHYRHRWRKGDIVIWDNRCSYHKAAGDYPPEEDRIHWRVSIKDRSS